MKPYHNTLPKPPITKPTINPNQNSKYPIREKRDDRRKKGLCMWCGIKFSPSHACIRSQLYHLLVADTGDTEEELEEFVDCDETPEDNSL